jgi:hypothetical protein
LLRPAASDFGGVVRRHYDTIANHARLFRYLDWNLAATFMFEFER